MAENLVDGVIDKAKKTASYVAEMQDPSLVFFEMMWLLQREFLAILIVKGKLPQYPLDMELKSGQQIVRDLLRDAADELHEACLTLKNSKNHRTSEETGFDRDHFIEEVIDSIKFCLGALIYANVTPAEFIRIFLEKTKTNIKRQESGY